MREPYNGHAPHNGTDTSEAAALAIEERGPRLRSRVLAFIESRGDRGATRDEIEVGTGLLMQTVAPRVAELKARGEVKDSGDRRPTRTGRQAEVLVAVAAPMASA